VGGKVGVVLGMGASGGVGHLGLFLEPLRGVRPDRLEHHQARLAVVAVSTPDQALVEERGDAVERIEVGSDVTGQRGGDRLDRLGQGRGKEGEEHEEALLAGLEEVVAPLDRRPERLLALGQVAGPAAEELQAVSEAVAESLGREEVQARRGQLDGQRQAIETPADLEHRGGVVVGQAEVGSHGPGPFDEELDRLEGTQGLGRDRTGRRSAATWADQEEALAADPERLAAGDEKLEVRHLEQLGGGRAAEVTCSKLS
jgi:hypothetical protein